MDINFNHINPTFLQHEGFTYLEFEGEFFKGCKRCGGEGHYSHNGEHSRCYTCDNTSAKLGDQFVDEAAAQKWCHEKAVRLNQKLRAIAAKQEMLERECRRHAAYLETTAPDVYAYLMSVTIDLENEYSDGSELEKNTFIRSMAETLRWIGKSRLFSQNMIDGVRKVMHQTEERLAESEAHPAPTGRLVVTGEIVSTKLVEGDYGTAYKILVKDDAGFKVWCSLPKAQADEAADAFYESNPETNHWNVGAAVWFVGSVNEPEKYTGLKGRRITFTATLEPSRDDVSFAFGSRPTKGAWL